MNRYSERTEPGILNLLIRSVGLFIVGIVIGILVVVLLCVALWILMSLLRCLG